MRIWSLPLIQLRFNTFVYIMLDSFLALRKASSPCSRNLRILIETFGCSFD